MGFLSTILSDGTECPPPYVGLDGKPVERTPDQWPYSYDEYVTYKSENYRPDDHAVYSDRMMDWSLSKFTRCVAKIWPKTPQSQMFHDKKPKDVERFLREYLEKNVVLTAILQGCSQANGFPYWVFLYHGKEEKP